MRESISLKPLFPPGDHPPQDAVPTLIEALGDKDKTVRAESCRVLGRIGPGARAAVPALKAALRDQDDIVRVQADEALRRIGS